MYNMTVVIVEFVNTYLLKVSLDLYLGLKVKCLTVYLSSMKYNVPA